MPDLAAIFRRPFAEQVAAFRLRLGNLVPTSRWDDISHAEHDSGFMVAGAIKADLLADLAAAVEKAVSQGTTLEEFRRDFRSIVEQRGWHGWTGDETEKGRAWRTRVIYRTNMATSYAAGRMAQLAEGKFAFWVYRHGNSVEPRLQHLAWDGIALPPDHPFWQTHAPPNGWGCSCRVFGARNAAGVKRVGGDPGKALPDGWQNRDHRTGAPEGIDKGWDYAPGASVSNLIQAMTAKPLNWDYSLATAFMRDLPEAERDGFSTAFRELPSLQTGMRRWVERVVGERNGAPIIADAQAEPQRTLGLATAAQIERIGKVSGVEVKEALYDFTVDQASVRHSFGSHGNATIEKSRGQRAITAADFGRLAALINAPDEVSAGDAVPTRGPIIRMSKRFGEEVLVAFFELRTRRRRLALVTMWVEKRAGTPPT